MGDLAQLRDGLRRLFGQQDSGPAGEDCDSCGVRPGSGCDSCGSADDLSTATPVAQAGPVQPSLLAAGPGDEVLDLSGDGGPEARAAAARVSPEGRAVSLEDDQEKMIQARLETARNGLTNVSFLLGQPDDLPVEDSSFDLVTANSVVTFQNQPGRVLAEMARVLNSKGRISIIEPVTLGSACRELEAPTEGQWLSWLAQAGFEGLEMGYLADGPAVIGAWTGSDQCRDNLSIALIEGRKGL